MVVKTAMKLLVPEIRNQIFECGYYPDNNYIYDVQKNVDWLAPNMKLFKELSDCSSIQQASIRQCITH